MHTARLERVRDAALRLSVWVADGSLKILPRCEHESCALVGKVKISPGEAPLLACRISLLSSSELRNCRLVRARKAEAGGSVHGLIIAEAAILGEREDRRRGPRSERTLWPSLMRAFFTLSLSSSRCQSYATLLPVTTIVASPST